MTNVYPFPDLRCCTVCPLFDCNLTADDDATVTLVSSSRAYLSGAPSINHADRIEAHAPRIDILALYQILDGRKLGLLTVGVLKRL